jgi:hypothetical protein
MVATPAPGFDCTGRRLLTGRPAREKESIYNKKGDGLYSTIAPQDSARPEGPALQSRS